MSITMALARRCALLALPCYRQSKLIIPNRGHLIMDSDWQPGPYPKNEEERRAAAKKYFMLPEEYEPYPQHHDFTCGDYPRLPNRGYDNQDPYGDYEDMTDYRHYGEPVHLYYELFNGLFFDTKQDDCVSNAAMFLAYAFGLSFIFCAIEFFEAFRFIGEAKPLHDPSEGKMPLIRFIHDKEPFIPKPAVHYHYPSSDLWYYH